MQPYNNTFNANNHCPQFLPSSKQNVTNLESKKKYGRKSN